MSTQFPLISPQIDLLLIHLFFLLALVNARLRRALKDILALYEGSFHRLVCVTGMGKEIGEKPPADLNNWLGLINPNCTLRGMSCYEIEIDYSSRRGIWPQIHKHQSCASA